MKLTKYISPLLTLFLFFMLFPEKALACHVPKEQDHKISICHVPPGNPENTHVINVDKSAWENGHNPHNSHNMDFVIDSDHPDCPKKTSATPTPTPTPTAAPVPTATPTPAPTANNNCSNNNSSNNSCSNNNSSNNNSNNNNSNNSTSNSNVLGAQTPELPKTGPLLLNFAVLALFPLGVKLRTMSKFKK